jgi:hypothetical protein
VSTTQRKTIIRRPGRPLLKGGDLNKTLEAVGMYSAGRSIEEISEELGWETASVRTAINQHFMNLKTLLETEALVASQTADGNVVAKRTTKQLNCFKNQRKIDEDINKSFLEKLSDPHDRLLSNEEVMFCYLSVHEGDARKALIDSGLAEGLTKSANGYQRALKLRILMLKGKINIIKYINGLQIDYAKELNINKEVIQTTIMRQLAQLEEQQDPRNAASIAKLTEQLGRTVGAFSDKIVIQEVSFDDAMDRMLDMRKKHNEEKGLEGETYVYDPDAIK